MKLLFQTIGTTMFALSIIACGGAQTGATTGPDEVPVDDSAPCMRSIAETISLDEALHFEENQSELTSEQRVVVTALAAALMEHGSAVQAVHVVGYARETESNPGGLAADRAAQIAIALTNIGVDSAQVGLRPASGYCPPTDDGLSANGCNTVDGTHVMVTFEQNGCRP